MLGFVGSCCLFMVIIGFCAVAAVNNVKQSDKKYDRRRRVRRLIAKGAIDEVDFEEEYWEDVTDEELDELEEDQ